MGEKRKKKKKGKSESKSWKCNFRFFFFSLFFFPPNLTERTDCGILTGDKEAGESRHR